MDDDLFVDRAWFLWVHDPCPEGGWTIMGTFDTQEEAVAQGKANHEREEKHYQEMLKYCAENDREKPWKRSSNCYDGFIVTPAAVFKMDAPKD